METGEVIYEKVFVSPRPLPKISLKHDWMQEFGSEVAQRPDGQGVQQFTSSQLYSGGRKTSRSQEIETRSFHEEAVTYERTRRPVVCRDTNHEPGNEQSMLNEVKIDFRILGLPHSVVKQAQNSRVRELVKKIENHPHRHALQRDLQQNKAYNPFSAKSKRMIQDVGNVELFELFETDPETQCKECLSSWIEGIVYCTCGHLLKEIVANRGFIEKTLDLLSIPEYVIKKGISHGHRYGKTPEKKEYHLAHSLKKRCMKRKFTGIHDLSCEIMFFVNVCSNMIEIKMFVLTGTILQIKDFTVQMSESEYFYYRQNGWISLNKSGDRHWLTIDKAF